MIKTCYLTNSSYLTNSILTPVSQVTCSVTYLTLYCNIFYRNKFQIEIKKHNGGSKIANWHNTFEKNMDSNCKYLQILRLFALPAVS